MRSSAGRSAERPLAKVDSLHERKVGMYSRANLAGSPCSSKWASNGHRTTRVSACSSRRPARCTGLAGSRNGRVNSSTVR